MNDLLTKLGGEGISAVLASVIALSGVVVSALISYVISRRSAYIAAVTAERSKWIDALRRNLSEFAGAVAHLHYRIVKDNQFLQSPEHDEAVEKIEILDSLITLQLNPFGTVEPRVIELVHKLPGIADSASDSRFRLAHSLLIRHSQFLLKDEWETVKFEAAGLFGRLCARWRKWTRKKLYHRFANNEGSLALLDRK